MYIQLQAYDTHCPGRSTDRFTNREQRNDIYCNRQRIVNNPMHLRMKLSITCCHDHIIIYMYREILVICAYRYII